MSGKLRVKYQTRVAIRGKCVSLSAILKLPYTLDIIHINENLTSKLSMAYDIRSLQTIYVINLVKKGTRTPTIVFHNTKKNSIKFALYEKKEAEIPPSFV